MACGKITLILETCILKGVVLEHSLYCVFEIQADNEMVWSFVFHSSNVWYGVRRWLRICPVRLEWWSSASGHVGNVLGTSKWHLRINVGSRCFILEKRWIGDVHPWGIIWFLLLASLTTGIPHFSYGAFHHSSFLQTFLPAQELLKSVFAYIGNIWSLSVNCDAGVWKHRVTSISAFKESLLRNIWPVCFLLKPVSSILYCFSYPQKL